MKTGMPNVLNDSHDFIEAGFSSHYATDGRLPTKVTADKLSIHDDWFWRPAAVTDRQRSSFQEANAHRVEVPPGYDAHHHRVAGTGSNRQSWYRQPKRTAAGNR
jgi:hypothetical protein